MANLPPLPASAVMQDAPRAQTEGIKLAAFRLEIPPGDTQHCDGPGYFFYVAEATQPLEVAIDDASDFFPWDAALSAQSRAGRTFRRVTVRNTGIEPLTGILYAGYGVNISDHRLHQLRHPSLNHRKNRNAIP